MLDLLKSRRKAPKPPRREKRELTVLDRTMPLLVAEHPRTTRMTLRIEPGGRGLKLTVPVGLPQREIDGFLARQQGWLMTKLARFAANDGLVEGASIPIRGVEHRIVRTGKVRGLTEVGESDGEAILYVGGAPEHLKRRIRDFLKREAERDLSEAVRRHTAAIGRKARSLRLKDTTSRWGSCTSEGELSFSWRIVMAPPHVIDYLAAHEVAHLVEMNHGPRFWALCRDLCPGMEKARRWLKQNGTLLHGLDFD